MSEKRAWKTEDGGNKHKVFNSIANFIMYKTKTVNFC